MRLSRGRFASVPTWVVVVAWVVLYVAVSMTAARLLGSVVTPVVELLLWAVAVWYVLRPWWSAAGPRRSAVDPPQRVLTAVAAVLPERRREWGRAMVAELAGIAGRPARWRFALSCVRAALWLRPAGGWPVLALVAGLAVASAAAAGPLVGAVVPGLRVFAVIFTGLVGGLVVLAVAYSRRPRLAAPAVLVTGAVAASIAVTVMFLRREPAAAEYLPPAGAAYLAAGLAGCLGVAVAAPRWLGTDRLAARLGVAAAVVFTLWFWLSNRIEDTRFPVAVMILLVPVVVGTPVAAFVVPAYAAGRAGRSLRSGLRAAVWTVIAVIPLAYTVLLPEALRRHAIDGRSWDGEVVAPVGDALASALAVCFGVFPVAGLMLGVIGAGLGARKARPPAVAASR
jgi:hypothetical protein